MTHLIRTLLFLAMLSTSGPAAAAVIMLYHHVDEDTPPSTSVTPEQFAGHLDRLEEEGFEVVRLDELVERVQAGLDPREKVASITFDDAYESILKTGIPMMEERGWEATVFVATEPVKNASRGMMSADEVRDLHDRGHLMVNHSHTHHHMVRRRDGESERSWLRRLREDTRKAQQLLAQWLGEEPPRYFAYPYGEHDPKVRELLREMGYKGFSQRSGAVDEHVNWMDVPRIPVNRQFAGWNGLGDKVRSLPMKIRGVEPDNSITDKARPQFTIQVPEGWRAGALNCFARGEPAEISRRTRGGVDHVTVRPAVDLRPGRTLVNCTASAGGGRFYWYSHLWMKRDNGQWYAE